MENTSDKDSILLPAGLSWRGLYITVMVVMVAVIAGLYIFGRLYAWT